MAILNSTTTVLEVKAAQCPYPSCDGLRTYFMHPVTGFPTPVDKSDIRIDLKRIRLAVGGSRENEDPYNVTITRTKLLINEGAENERYKVTDSFSVPGETFVQDKLTDSSVKLDFLDEKAGHRRKVRRRIVANTDTVITLNKPIPLFIDGSLEDVNVEIVTKQSLLSGKAGKRRVRKRLWERYIFVCEDCGKPYFVDKP